MLQSLWATALHTAVNDTTVYIVGGVITELSVSAVAWLQLSMDISEPNESVENSVTVKYKNLSTTPVVAVSISLTRHQ